MLSKLRRAEGRVSSRILLNHNDIEANLNNWFGDSLSDLTLITGGTLSVSFKGSLGGEARFFKTHSSLSGRATLRKEAAFLGATSSSVTDPVLLRINEGGAERTWLHTRFLEPGQPLHPTEALDLITSYESQIQLNPELVDEVPAHDRWRILLSKGEEAVDLLAREEFCSPDVLSSISAAIDRVGSESASLPLQLCHGDLGPSNILISEGIPVAVDWEDALWGIPGYDYLYWLTFHENRRWLSRTALGKTILGEEIEIAILVIVLALKSWLSVKVGAHQKNKLAINDRILEALDLA